MTRLDKEEQKTICRKAEERFQDLDAARQPHEQSWREIAEYVLPRRDFEIRYGTPSIRQRRLLDTTAKTSNDRLAALLFGYMMPPYRPWVRPTVRGRDPSFSESRWFEARQRGMFDDLQSPRSLFTSSSHESLQDDVAFGNSVLWTGRSRPGGPVIHIARPLMECYWDEDADGQVNTLYRKFKLKLRSSVARYPTPKLVEKFQKDPQSSELIDFLHPVDPREDGVVGGPSFRKPFRSDVLCLTTMEVARQSGYETFPYAVTRFSKRSGDPYGEGPGLDAVPLARLLNEMEETILRAAELECDPPMVSMVGRIPKLDRRPGGLTNLTASQIRRFDDPRAVLQRLYESGNPNMSVELVRDIRERIQFLYFIDWMSLAVGSNPTATEINERRDIRLRSMTPIVSRGEAEKLTAIAERRYELEQDDFDPPPSTLDGEELGWEYFSPLAQAQQQGALETFQRVMGIIDAAAMHNPDVADNFDIDNQARETARAAGWPVKDLRQATQIEQTRQLRARAAEEERAAALAQAAAGAARDAGQAAASVGATGAAA